MRTALWLTCALALAGCGGGETQHPLVGTYVMDVEKTVAAASEGGAGKTTDKELQALRKDFASYVLVLAPGGVFDLRVGEGGTGFHLEGRWSPTEGGLSLETTRAGGEAVAPEEGTDAEARVEGGWIVLVAPDGRRMYLRRS